MRLKRRKATTGPTLALVKRGSKQLACEKGCGNEERVDATTSSVICSLCVQQMVQPPEQPKPPLSPEEKALRSARKLEKARQFEAKRSKLVVAPTSQDLGFVKGWQWKRLFTTSLDTTGRKGKQMWFSLGKPVGEAEYDRLKSEFANEAVAKATAPAVKVAVSNAAAYTLVDPQGNKHTLTIREFFKTYGLWSGHVKKLIAGFKPSYKGWTVAK